MNKIQFNINRDDFLDLLNGCTNEPSPCTARSTNSICLLNAGTVNDNYNNLIDKIINHFNYIITINKETKNTFGNKFNNDKLNKRYVYYDSLDIDYENTWLKKLTFWMYFIAILLYISVFILKNLYKKRIEFLYLFIIIIIPFFSEKLIHVINYFYKFNVLFTNN